MTTSKEHMINDRILRPWLVNDIEDEYLKQQCYELDKAARRSAPYKKAGDYGPSSLDVQPRELIEIEKLLLNLDSYPIIKKKHPSDREEVLKPTQLPQNGRTTQTNTEPARTSSAPNRRSSPPELVHESKQVKLIESRSTIMDNCTYL